MQMVTRGGMKGQFGLRPLLYRRSRRAAHRAGQFVGDELAADGVIPVVEQDGVDDAQLGRPAAMGPTSSLINARSPTISSLVDRNRMPSIEMLIRSTFHPGPLPTSFRTKARARNASRGDRRRSAASDSLAAISAGGKR